MQWGNPSSIELSKVIGFGFRICLIGVHANDRFFFHVVKQIVAQSKIVYQPHAWLMLR
jgi:hypothetical protein